MPSPLPETAVGLKLLRQPLHTDGVVVLSAGKPRKPAEVVQMFQVPGWNVSAKSLVQQTAEGKKIRTHDQSDGAADSTRKRKRPDEGVRKVTGDELDRLWNAQFQDGARVRPGKRKTKKHAEVVDAGRSSNHLDHSTRTKDAPQVSAASADPKPARKETRTGRLREDASLANSTVEPGADEHEEQDQRTRQAKKKQEKQNEKQKREEVAPVARPAAPPPSNTALTPLQAKMRAKLTSSRFRHLNQTLYTTTSAAAFTLFSQSPELFAEYHAGFAQQVKSSWPQNPVDQYVHAIQTRGRLQDGQDWEGLQPLPRRKTGSCTIADLGCGDAPLARALQRQVKALQLKFHNYDLHSPNSLVTVADIASLPLRDGEADIAIFCLSLMGTNWLTFIDESWRILRGDGKGEVWVAEVKSRFGRVLRKRVVENSVGKKRRQQANEADTEPAYAEDTPDQTDNETDVSAFVSVIERRGFTLKPVSVDKSNKMFVNMVFVKSGIPGAGKYKGWKWSGGQYHMTRLDDDDAVNDDDEEAKVLKPCVYKNR